VTTIAHPETTEVANHLIGQGDNVLTAELVHPEELMSGLLSQVWRLLCCLAHHPTPAALSTTFCHHSTHCFLSIYFASCLVHLYTADTSHSSTVTAAAAAAACFMMLQG